MVKFGMCWCGGFIEKAVLPMMRNVKNAQAIVSAFITKAVSLGGTISAEHGVGKIKHEYLKLMYGEAGVNEMQRVKKIFDPNFMLGRNNIFPAA